MMSTDLSRRSFLRAKITKPKNTVIRPPWSIKGSLFVDICTRCDACIKACPEKIIFKGDGGYPEVNYKRGECTYCKECVNSCEHDVFFKEELKIENAWSHKASVKPSCLSIRAITCRVCGDTCDESAISFKLQVGGVSVPMINTQACNGCGACVYSCPENAISMLDDSQ